MISETFRWETPTSYSFMTPFEPDTTPILFVLPSCSSMFQHSFAMLFYSEGSHSSPRPHVQQWYNLCFSVQSSLLNPSHIFSSVQPMSKNLFCVQPRSTMSFLATLTCLPVHFWLVSRHIKHSWVLPSCRPHSCLAAHYLFCNSYFTTTVVHAFNQRFIL